MAAPINRGDDNPQLQRQNYQFDWRRGTTYSEDWKGINQSKMISKWNGTVFKVSSAKLTLQNSMAEAQFEWSSDRGGATPSNSIELTIDRWEIPDPKDSKPLISHPIMYDIFYQMASGSNLGSSDGAICSLMAQFQKGVNNNTPALDCTDVPTGAQISGWFKYVNFPGISAISSEQLAYLIRAYNKCINGQTHYQSSQYSLRHTTNTPSYWTANIADSNVNCIYQTYQMLGEVTDPSLWNFPLPFRLQYKVNAAANAFFNSLSPYARYRPGYMIGWLKSPSAEASTGRDRVELQGDFVLDQWPLDTYPAAI